MIGSQDIRRWAETCYINYLRSLIEAERFRRQATDNSTASAEFFPLRKGQIGKIPASATPEAFITAAKPLMDASKNVTGTGYTVILASHQRRKRSLQNEPDAVEFTTESDYITFLNRKSEVARFKNDIATILAAIPQSHSVLSRQPRLVIDNHGHWLGILEVIAYLCKHPRPQCYVRALPVSVHTKFINEHETPIEELLTILPETCYDPKALTFASRCGFLEDEPSIRGRFLCGKVMQLVGFPIGDMRLRISEWAKLPLLNANIRVLACENKTNFLALPSMPNTLALWGQGGAVSGYLAKIVWLHKAQLYYWGDLDPCGFAILARLRAIFPHLCSILMDGNILKNCRHQLTPAKLPPGGIEYQHLTNEEAQTARELFELQKGLEQERLLFHEALNALLTPIEQSR